jgi:hypothetical protein
MKHLTILLTACLTAGCMNMNKAPERWVTVLDVDTRKPAVGVPMVYTHVKKPYWIVGQVVISRTYPTDEQGRAHVPAGVYLRPSPGVTWVRANDYDKGKSGREILRADTIFLRTFESHMEWLDRTEHIGAP